MPAKVIDASALAALLFAEPEAESVLEQIEDGPLAAPRLLPYEIASVCLKKMRRHPKKRDMILSAYKLWDRIPIEWVDVPLEKAVLLAEQHSLTLYDATYVWLARAFGADLITLDQQVLKAFRHV
jgi:predicted nucleic acid-binding protein